MTAEKPEWADADDDETEVDVVEQEPDDGEEDVPDSELEEVALNTPVNLMIESTEADDR